MVVEASRHGTPAVVVEAPDNAAVELVDEGVNGFRVPSADPADLGAAVVRCLAGGQSLRQSTWAWYERTRRTRSVHRTAAKCWTSSSPSWHASLPRRRSDPAVSSPALARA